MKMINVFLMCVLLLIISAGTASSAGSQENSSESIILTAWLSGEPGTVNGYSEILESFSEIHPEITVEVVFVGSDLFNPTLVPALSSGEGPDIFMFGTGPGQPAAIIAGGLVKSLNDYALEYGWEEVIPPNVINYTSSNGQLWSIGDQVESTMMFYNRIIFEEVGIEVPKTLDEFYSILDRLKEAGYNIPIGIGGADRWPISHWQSMLFGNFAGPDKIDDVMFDDGRWDEPIFVEAAAFLQDLGKKGYFGPTPNAQGYGEIMDSFWAGAIPMTFTGPWVIGDALTKLGDSIEDFSVFMVPPMNDEKKIYPTEDIGGGWYINAACEHPDLAAELLDFLLMKDSSRAKLLETGTSWPVGPVSDVLKTIELPKLRKEMANLVDKYRSNGTVHAFLDTVQPARTTEATYNGLQGLLGGDLTPKEFCEAIQNSWEMDKADNLIMIPGGIER